MRKILLCGLLLVSLMAAADVTGTWNFTVETSQGTGNPVFVLEQKGKALTGTYSGALGKAKVAGAVKENKVEIKFKASFNGEDVDVVYSGIVDGDTMKGDVVLGRLGKATFTGTRQK